MVFINWGIRVIMKNDGVYVYWINQDFYVRGPRALYPHNLKGNATYQSEAWHISSDAEYIEIIPIIRSEEPQYKEAVQKLRDKADELRMKK